MNLNLMIGELEVEPDVDNGVARLVCKLEHRSHSPGDKINKIQLTEEELHVFATETGLSTLLFGPVPEHYHRPHGFLETHRAEFTLLKKEDLTAVQKATIVAEHVAILEWLRYWIAYALRHCEIPIFYVF